MTCMILLMILALGLVLTTMHWRTRVDKLGKINTLYYYGNMLEGDNNYERTALECHWYSKLPNSSKIH